MAAAIGWAAQTDQGGRRTRVFSQGLEELSRQVQERRAADRHRCCVSMELLTHMNEVLACPAVPTFGTYLCFAARPRPVPPAASAPRSTALSLPLPLPLAHPTGQPPSPAPPKSVVSPSRLLSLSTKQVTPSGRSFQSLLLPDDTDFPFSASRSPSGPKQSDAVGPCSGILRKAHFPSDRRLVEPLV
ncbi:hypothetical protein CCMA1212_000190 [Trichoderma ghanense]|uniref:Uncharacterized protein n=1 Tax=Trichoderma ghanense TaxID=65468 RepID=A0ABY2HGC5_9HYPO